MRGNGRRRYLYKNEPRTGSMAKVYSSCRLITPEVKVLFICFVSFFFLLRHRLPYSRPFKSIFHSAKKLLTAQGSRLLPSKGRPTPPRCIRKCNARPARRLALVSTFSYSVVCYPAGRFAERRMIYCIYKQRDLLLKQAEKKNKLKKRRNPP